jgi:hypothetical protein
VYARGVWYGRISGGGVWPGSGPLRFLCVQKGGRGRPSLSGLVGRRSLAVPQCQHMTHHLNHAFMQLYVPV